MMDSALRTISYIADIGSIVVLMARRRAPEASPEDFPDSPDSAGEGTGQHTMICYVFESEDVSVRLCASPCLERLSKTAGLFSPGAPLLLPPGSAHRTVHWSGLQRGLQRIPASQRHQPHRAEPETIQRHHQLPGNVPRRPCPFLKLRQL